MGQGYSQGGVGLACSHLADAGRSVKALAQDCAKAVAHLGPSSMVDVTFSEHPPRKRQMRLAHRQRPFCGCVSFCCAPRRAFAIAARPRMATPQRQITLTRMRRAEQSANFARRFYLGAHGGRQRPWSRARFGNYLLCYRSRRWGRWSEWPQAVLQAWIANPRTQRQPQTERLPRQRSPAAKP